MYVYHIQVFILHILDRVNYEDHQMVRKLVVSSRFLRRIVTEMTAFVVGVGCVSVMLARGSLCNKFHLDSMKA